MHTTIRTITRINRQTWNAAVSHPLQSYEWGQFKQSMGLKVIRIGEFSGNTLKTAVQMTIHSLPILPFTIGYVPRSTIPNALLMQAIKEQADIYRSVFIQFEPNALAQQPNHIPSVLRPSSRPLFPAYTFILDLTKSEDELLSAMHQKTRYNIRLSKRHGVVVRENNSRQAFEAYIHLTEETTRRQKYFAHSERYHRIMWKTMRQSGIAKLFTAEYRGSILAAWIVFVFHDTVYYPYGASSRLYRNVMAPSLLLWEIALWAKSMNMKKFDLWGALGPTPNRKDPWYGFHVFKQGFGPTLVQYVGSYDYVIHPVLYKGFVFSNTLRWGILKVARSMSS